MKKIIFCFFITVFILFFVACKNSNDSIEIISYTDTIKALTEEKNNTTVWTEKIDENILGKSTDDKQNTGTSDVGLTDNAAEKQKLEVERAKSKNDDKKKSILLPEGLFLGKNSKIQNNIYPHLEGFGSLDLTLIAPEDYKTVDSLIKSFSEKKLQEDLIYEDSYYLKIILQLEIEQWPEILYWIIGKPFRGEIESIDSEIYEVPVRIFFSNGYRDVLVNLISTEKEYLVDQVLIGTLKDSKNGE